MPKALARSLIRAATPIGIAALMLTVTTPWAQQPGGIAAPTPVGGAAPAAPAAPATPAAAAPVAAKSGTFSKEELEQMAAPIALYPDPLLAQVLMASTYPLEVVEAARWRKANASLTGDAVAEALKMEDWDPAVKSLATFPDVLAMMDEKIDWTQKLGDAFLAQQTELMDSVQRLRARAKAEGTLMSSKEQTVTEEKAPPPPADAAPAAPAAAAATPPPTTIIKIEPADPEVVYVPTYNPTVVYGAWPYPAYPPYYYYPPMYPPGAAFFSFTAGVIVGGALWGSCGWGWGHSEVNINVNRYNNFNGSVGGGGIGGVGGVGGAGGVGGVGGVGGAGGAGGVGGVGGVGGAGGVGGVGGAGQPKWQHNPEHRKGAQYRDSATQNKYGRGQSSNSVQSREQFRGRAEQGRRDIAAGGATRDLAGNQLGGASASNRLGGGQAGGAGNRAGTQPSTGNRAGGGAAAGGTRPSTGSVSNRSSSSNRSGAFGGSSTGSAARSASQRGYSSRSAGGFSRGGGGGGFSRGGGGRR